MDIEGFIGIPYVAHGRDYEGADCWGIVCLFYRDALGRLIPSYSAEMAARTIHRRDVAPLIEIERERWQEVKTPIAGDVVLMRIGRCESHVGVFVGNGLMLHSEVGASELIRLTDMRVRSRVVGYFRSAAC